MDPIANMLTQLRNSGRAGQKETAVNYSKMNLAILKIFKDRGFISDFSEEKKENQKYPGKIIVTLKYKNRTEMAFQNIKRISRPGRRIYIASNRISKVSRGKVDVVVSTSAGVMTGAQARRKGLGGELICEVV